MLLGMYIELCVSWGGQETFEHASPAETKLKDSHVCAVQYNSDQTDSLDQTVLTTADFSEGSPGVTSLVCNMINERAWAQEWNGDWASWAVEYTHCWTGSSMHSLFYARGQLGLLFAIAISLESLAEVGGMVKYRFYSIVRSSHTCHFWFGAVFPVLHVLALMCSP